MMTKTKTLFGMIVIIAITASCKNESIMIPQKPVFEPFLSYEKAIAKADSILNLLTLDERIELIGGHNFFFIKGVPQFNIPDLYLSDATQGVHIRKQLSDQLEKSVAFPAPIAVAATWNPNLAHQMARSIGEECRAGGIQVLLGPGMNIYRISQNGRNFEYFGEDPFLAARMIENYVVGMQSTGTISTLKHFVVNNTDHHRRTSNSVIDLRTLHEIYLPAFKAGIDAGAMAVMTSYNQVNGEWAGQSQFVITDLLRNQLGFKWLVMSDWWSNWDPEKTIKSGLDVEMPGHGLGSWSDNELTGDIYVRTNAKRLLAEGKVSESDINRMARNVLAISLAMGLDQRPQRDTTLLEKFTEHEQIALQTAREAMVLLKNENQLLPLTPEAEGTIIVTGDFVTKVPAGQGSAEVEGYNLVNLEQAMQTVYGNKSIYVQNPTDEQIKSARAMVVTIGTIDSEGWDTPFELPDSALQTVLRYASLNSKIIIVVNSGGGRNISAFAEKVPAIIYAWYPGQNGYLALAEILSGKTNPSGKLPITLEKQFADAPGFGYIPKGDSLYVGWGPDFDMNRPNYDINYTEGVMVGYRWFQHKQIEPLYWFGHGLSYTTFDYSGLKVKLVGDASNAIAEVEFTLTNNGKVAGAEVAQIYVSDPECSVIRPVQELKGFVKETLKPGESKNVKVVLSNPDFAFYDVESKGWKVEPGKFVIKVGAASNSIKLEKTIEIK